MFLWRGGAGGRAEGGAGGGPMVEEEEWGRRRKMKKGHIPSYLIIRLQIISQRHDHTSGPSKQPAVVSNLRNSPKQKANFFSAFINVQVFERFFELNQQI